MDTSNTRLTDALAKRLQVHGDLSGGDVDLLHGLRANVRRVSAGVDIQPEGEPAGPVFGLCSGWAYRFRTLSGGSRQITGIMLPGDWSDMRGIDLDHIDHGTRTLTDARVVVLSRERLNQVFDRHRDILRAFARARLVEERILETWVTVIGRLTARQRVAHFLCEIEARLSAIDQHAGEIPLLQHEFADILGLSPVHVNRTIKQLRTEGVITTYCGRITVTDYRQLAVIANFDPSYLHQSRTKAGQEMFDQPFPGLRIVHAS